MKLTRKLYNAIKTSFLSNTEIPREAKAEVGRVVKPMLTHSCESCTTNKRQRSKMNSTEMRSLSKGRSGRKSCKTNVGSFMRIVDHKRKTEKQNEQHINEIHEKIKE